MDERITRLSTSHTARFVAGADAPRRFPELPHPEFAFAGRSNVGKSSLLNRLVGQRKLARVSKTPGRTQQINFFEIDGRLTFADLPGYGFARVPLPVKAQWKALVESYLTRRARLCAVIVIVDLRRGLGDEDSQLIEFLAAQATPAIVVATKADKLGHNDRTRCVRELSATLAPQGVPAIVCSSASGDGIDRVWQAIAQHSGGCLLSRVPRR